MSQQNRYTILIVDDNTANLRILGATFEDDGFVVHTASTVLAAQALLQAHVDSIDLVLSDIQMPGLSGFDLVTWMKAERTGVKDIPILLITSQLPDSANRIRGLSLGAVDYMVRSLDPQELVLRVTHAIENFNQIRSLRHNLETTENLAATGRLFAASNHEIKNVSQFIKLATGILARDLDSLRAQLSPSCTQALTMLRNSSDLLADITKTIGSIIGDVVTPICPVDLDSLLAKTMTMVRPMLRDEIELVYVPTCRVFVSGSATFLQQVFINLLLNARDAIVENKSGSHGVITIEVEAIDSMTTVVHVRDNGVGFSTQETRTTFLPFASTKQMRGGTGLGLWLSSHLLEKMNGAVSLASAGPGAGATADVTLKNARP